jgi:hypothetical protein
VDCGDLLFVERSGFDAADIAFYRSATRISFSERVGRNLRGLPRFHPQIRAFFLLCGSRLLVLASIEKFLKETAA